MKQNNLESILVHYLAACVHILRTYFEVFVCKGVSILEAILFSTGLP